MKKLLVLIFVLTSLYGYSQRTRITNNVQQYKVDGKFYLQIDSTGNGGSLVNYDNFATWKYVQDYVLAHGGNSYTNGYGLNLNTNIFSVDTTAIAYKTWAAARATLMSAGYGLTGGGSLAANRTFVVDSATLAQYFVRRKDSLTTYYPFQTNPLSYLTNVFGYIIAGSGIDVSGLGTAANPLIITALGGGGGGGATNINIGSGYRFAVPNTNNIKTHFAGYALLEDSTTNTNAITTKVDSATLFVTALRRKDSTTGGYYPYSNPSNFVPSTTIASTYVPQSRLVNTGYGLTGGGALSGNLTLKVDTTTILYQLPQTTVLVVSKSGSDVTGVRGRLDKPFLTIRGALNAASAGDLIQVYPGTYEEASPISLAKGVSYSFIGKGTVQLNAALTSGTVFTDSSTVATTVILASGWKFEGRSTQVVLNQSVASNVTIDVNEMVSSNGKTINTGTNAVTFIKANRIAGNAFSGTIWLTSCAKFVADIKQLESGAFGNAYWSANAKYVNIHAQRIFCDDPTNDDYLVYVQSSASTDSVFIEAQEMKSGTEWAVWAKGTSPAIHIKAERISANSDCVVVSSTDPGGMLTVQSDVIENTTTGAMDGIVHGEGGSLTVIGARIIRNALATGNDVKTVIFGGDTGYVRLIAVAYDKTKVSDVPTGTVTRIDNHFQSGISADNLTNTDSVAYTLGYNRTTKNFVTVANPFAGRTLVVPLTDAATITTDASLGYTFGSTYRVTLGGNRTIANPTNLTDGQRLIYEIHQDGTGNRSVTWGSMFTWSDDLPIPTLSTTLNYVDQIGVVYNSTANKLYVTGINKGIH